MTERLIRAGLTLLCVCIFFCHSPVFAAEPSAEQRNLTELRNTIVNLLQALVQRGVITKEQADAMVRDAQAKAEADLAAQVARQKAEEQADKGAVRVPYVPEIVKEEIGKQVAAELGPGIKQEIVADVTSKKSLFSALPDWMQRMVWTGDLRFRTEGDVFASDNAVGAYYNFNAINSAGGISQAGPEALLNTTEDQKRLRVRVRFGFDTDLGSGWSAGMRLATGSTGQIVATTNQTLGAYEAGYTVTFDQAYLRWLGTLSNGRQVFTVTGGRFADPWLSTDLIWYNDLTFEGLTGAYRLNLTSDNAHRHDLFATLGAIPIESFSVFDPNPTGEQKWLVAAQIGTDLHLDSDARIRFGAAYYDYSHITGIENSPASTLYNWTAPTFVQKGNTLFDISNSANLSTPTNLFALAADFRIIDLITVAEMPVFSRYTVGLTAEALENIGYHAAEVAARTGQWVPGRTRGYRADLAFGSRLVDQFGSWRASVGYRYLQRDAVVDAFNDEDFHLGGTDAKGYTALFDFSLNPHVWLRLKYMTANSIDGPPLGIDVWQFDVNGRF